MSSSITVYDEFEPDPNDEEMWENCQPIEVDPYSGQLVFRLYTPEEMAKKEERLARLEKLMGPQPPKREIIKDDTYYALYESDLEEDKRPPPPRVEPHLEERDPRPIFSTKEEKDLYYGSDDSQDANSQLLASPAPNYAGMNLEKDMNLDEELPPTSPLASNLAPQNIQPQNPLTLIQGQAHRIECEYEFKLKPGDVMVFLELRTRGQPPNPFQIQRYIEVHKDMNHFEDMGQYRVNFMDTYGPLYDGDMVVRFGNFGKYYNWNPRDYINCYVYFIDVKPLGDDSPPSCPWYWIEDLRVKVPPRPKTSVAIPNPVPQYTPIREVVPNFALRDGDILMAHVWDTKLGHFDRIKSYVWNPLLASIGMEKFINHEDRVLRYGLSYHQVLCRGRSNSWFDTVVEIHVELYSFRKTSFDTFEGEWIFLGRSDKCFDDRLTRGCRSVGKIKEASQVPLAGDILFVRGLRFSLDPDPIKRMGPKKLWYPEFNIGGIVSFYTWEYLKFYGREPRAYNRFTDKGKYGVGNTTMALRFGTFNDPKDKPDNPIWTWHERETVELYVINTRGSTWRRVAVSIWPKNTPRPLPNYGWQPHNPHNIEDVPRYFRPQAGDIIIRLDTDPEWVKMKADPELVGDTYNPHYDVNIKMGIFEEDSSDFQQGDYLIRAGYAKNEVNPTWTNATVELYHMEGKDSWLNTKSPWKFRGRDAFIFGTDSWRVGGLDKVEKSGAGDMSVSEVAKLTELNRAEFVKLDPSEVWRQKGYREAYKIGPEWQNT